MEFLDILLEAKGDKPSSRTNKIKVNNETGSNKPTDYTAEQDDDDQDGTETVDTSTDDAGDTDDTPTDYTEEEVESDPDEDGENPDDADGGEGDNPEATDYTQEGGDEDGADGDTDSGGDSNGDMGGSDETSEEDLEAQQEKENQRILLEDFISLFYLVKNTITKLTGIDKSNIVINKIITQINANLNLMKQHLFDFITFEFEGNKYVTNLFKYNYFLEAFRINAEMLKKINVFIPN